MLTYLYLLHQYFVEEKIGQQCTCTTNGKKINITEIAAWKPSPISKNDARPLVFFFFFRKKKIIWAAVGSSAAVFLADINLFIGRTTNFVFVGSRYNIFCVGGRQSLNNPSNVPQSSSVHNSLLCLLLVGRHSKKIPNSYYISTDHRQT